MAYTQSNDVSTFLFRHISFLRVAEEIAVASLERIMANVMHEKEYSMKNGVPEWVYSIQAKTVHH